jgi:hypothetical protein
MINKQILKIKHIEGLVIVHCYYTILKGGGLIIKPANSYDNFL